MLDQCSGLQAEIIPETTKSLHKLFVSQQNGRQIGPSVLQGTKAAVLNMAEILAQELSPFGIHVTTVIPGWVKSDIINEESERFERCSTRLPKTQFPSIPKTVIVSAAMIKPSTYTSALPGLLRAKHAYHFLTLKSAMTLVLLSQLFHVSCRFERPDSFFQYTIDAIKERRRAGIKQGCTPQKAAQDIANGLSKPKPPRFQYTGTVLLYALFWGFVQQWMRPQFLADSLVQRCNLPQSVHLTPTEYKGPYQEPKRVLAVAPEE